MFNWKKNKKNSDSSAVKKSNLGTRIAELFGKSANLEDFYEELEEVLISGDMGGVVTMELVAELRERVLKDKLKDKETILLEFKRIISKHLITTHLVLSKDELNLFLVLGVNGVGKTTTIAKLAQYYKNKGFSKIVLSAGDTFRAAAIDQLKIHGERTGLRVVAQKHGSDPGAVIYDTIASAYQKGDELILADTAGRMHNKKNLVNELMKINKIISTNLKGRGEYKKILVIDATTGQNGLQQAEVFHEAIGVDAVILTKYDATARGGLVVAINKKLKIPVSFVGHGEGLDDLSEFNAEQYLDDLLAI
ncbi:MAG: signal recognition particle-docking protein FtsY [Spirochaetaceae bacterium 4572_59]|nr:MAG: signal recognition particle-docking protein FtsY [Spirochaetaceae bacterium 4572_59]